MEIITEKDIIIDITDNPMFQWSKTLNLPSVVDWNQLQYQNIYQTPDYVASKFSGNYYNLPGFDKVIERMAKNVKTPLDELIYRYSIVNEFKEDGNNTNLAEFKNSQ